MTDQLQADHRAGNPGAFVVLDLSTGGAAEQDVLHERSGKVPLAARSPL
jgi:hypothetical protein